MFQPVTGQKTFGQDLPDYDALTNCIRCGRCLPVCPTYQQTALETFSPRGRLNLLRAVEDGRLDLEEPGVEAHLYHCLDCRACNTVCPAGISIGELIVQGRAAVEHVHRRSRIVRFALNVVLASPRHAEAFAAPLRLVQALKLDRLAVLLMGWVPKLGPALRELVQVAPAMSRPIRGELSSGWAADKRIGRVGFFLGCVMNVAYADASRASVALMQRFGCQVVTPPAQACCGAPHDDQGMKDQARAFAMRNIAAFERLGDVDAIVADCAACSGFLKEYAHIFHGDPEWAERARQFSSRVRDMTEWLDEILPPVLPGSEVEQHVAGQGETLRGPFPFTSLRVRATAQGDNVETTQGDKVRVTYHEPCHLAHAQGVRRQPRAVLARLNGIDLRDSPDSTRCCGSAGIYNLTHPGMSKDLLDRKMADVASTGAQVVVSANPGCLLQLEWGVRRRRLPIEVKHITQVVVGSLEHVSLSESYRRWTHM